MDGDDAERRAHAAVLSIVSHDIRAPLGVILGAVSELVDPRVGALSDDQRRLVQLVRRSSERLARLAANVLFLNRAASGRVLHKVQRVDARVLVRHAVEAFERSGEAARAPIAAALPSEAVDVDADPELATQAIANVVANAIRFARERVGITLAVEGETARIVVEDDGPGVAGNGDQVAQLFDPVARLQGEGPRGLGLIVTKGIVDAHGGSIHAESRVDDAGRTVGARFVVTLLRAG